LQLFAVDAFIAAKTQQVQIMFQQFAHLAGASIRTSYFKPCACAAMANRAVRSPPDTFVTTCAKIRDPARFFAGDAGNMRLHKVYASKHVTGLPRKMAY
jgi:hypothetical protein